MAPPDSEDPLPPSDFADRHLPIDEVPAGTTFVRIHRRDLDPIYFGRSGRNRFDDPERKYGVCYLAMTPEGAFAETCLRDLGVGFVARAFLEVRSFATIEVTAQLRLASVHGTGLSRLGATSVVNSGRLISAQRWSRAIHDHPTNPDGILYRANHNDAEFSVALFERCSDHIQLNDTRSIMADRVRLGNLLNHYGVGLG